MIWLINVGNDDWLRVVDKLPELVALGSVLLVLAQRLNPKTWKMLAVAGRSSACVSSGCPYRDILTSYHPKFWCQDTSNGEHTVHSSIWLSLILHHAWPRVPLVAKLLLILGIRCSKSVC